MLIIAYQYVLELIGEYINAYLRLSVEISAYWHLLTKICAYLRFSMENQRLLALINKDLHLLSKSHSSKTKNA